LGLGVVVLRVFAPVFLPPGAVLPEHCQAFAVDVEVHQCEVRAQPVVVLGDASVSDLVEAEDALEDAEHMLHWSARSSVPVRLLV
jgi:hypothetical protein